MILNATIAQAVLYGLAIAEIALMSAFPFDVGEKANNGGDEATTIVYVIQKDRNFKR